jgi:D-alanyl-D-alanine carboxypeptidase (penicillin-binding protein 5/6)
MNRALTYLTFTALTVAGCFMPYTARAMDTIAREALMMDYETGTILLDKNANAKMPTSSMSKTMTLYMVFDALKQGKVTMDTEFPVSEKAWRTQGSKMFVHVGDKVKVEDLIRGVAIQSGNDATIVLAEGLAGSEEAFAEAMTAKAKEIGMTNSHFTNASGWPDPETYTSVDELRHYSTAADLATLSRRLIKDFPDYYHYFSEIEFSYNNIKQGNRNPLLYQNLGADGIKTGHTEIAGYGLMGTAMQKGRRVILVVNGLTSMNERAQESGRLIELGLKSFENVSVVKEGQALVNVPVVLGDKTQIPATVAHGVKMTVPAMSENKVEMNITYKKPLIAPIKTGDKIGTLSIKAADQPALSVDVVAGGDVAEKGFFAAFFEKMVLNTRR